jgi:uncharacterized membrane protein YebE (DUF533 family)
MAGLQDRVLDLGLNVLDTEATHMYICSADPATFTAASSTNALGSKNWGAGAAVGAPVAGTPNGRQVPTTAITDGTVSANGNAAYWALTDNGNSRLLASGPLSAAQAVVSGNTWQLGSFNIRIPSS